MIKMCTLIFKLYGNMLLRFLMVKPHDNLQSLH